MTAHRDLKNLIRSRQVKTGESYTAARARLMGERAARLGLREELYEKRFGRERPEVVLSIEERFGAAGDEEGRQT